MQAFNYCASGKDNANPVLIITGVGSFDNESEANKAATECYFNTYKSYPQSARSFVIPESILRHLLNSTIMEN